MRPSFVNIVSLNTSVLTFTEHFLVFLVKLVIEQHRVFYFFVEGKLFNTIQIKFSLFMQHVCILFKELEFFLVKNSLKSRYVQLFPCNGEQTVQ